METVKLSNLKIVKEIYAGDWMDHRNRILDYA